MADWTLFLHGGIQAEIIGENPERFLNIASQRGLMVKNVAVKGHITFWTTPQDYRNMKAIAKKTRVRIRILSKQGLPFFLYRRRKRKLLVVGVVSFFFLLYVSSLYIWDISFEGNYRLTDEMLLHYMESVPIEYGMKKRDISCSELEESIRKQFSEISWVSAEIQGTRLIISLKENEAYPESEIRSNEPCDLTAKKAGTIVRSVVRSGLSKVRSGDMVEAGDLLVDGTIPIYDDSTALINSHEVHADAEIYANTTHLIWKTFPATEMIRSRTGNVRKGVFLKIFDWIFYLMIPSEKDTSWEFFSEQRQLKALKNYYLPVYIGNISSYEYVEYERNYTEEQMEAILSRLLEEYMEKLQEKGIQILASDGKIEQNESGWQITGTLSVIENIAVETRSNIRKERGDLISR